MHRDDETRVAHAATFPRVTRIRSPIRETRDASLTTILTICQTTLFLFHGRSSFRPVAVNLFSLSFNFLSSFGSTSTRTLVIRVLFGCLACFVTHELMAAERINMILQHAWPFSFHILEYSPSLSLQHSHQDGDMNRLLCCLYYILPRYQLGLCTDKSVQVHDHTS